MKHIIAFGLLFSLLLLAVPGSAADERPDLTFLGNMELTSNGTSVGDEVTISVKIVNVGKVLAEDVEIALSVDGGIEKVHTIRSIGPLSNDDITVIISYIPTYQGHHELSVLIDPEDSIAESDETNNVLYRGLEVTNGSLSEEVDVETSSAVIGLIPILIIGGIVLFLFTVTTAVVVMIIIFKLD